MRRWLMAVGAALVAGAILELVLLGVVIWRIGVAWTLALLVAKGVLGYLLARRVGRRGWRQFRAALDVGRPPGPDVTDAAVALAGAMLILLGGFLCALIGLTVLIPPVRRRVAQRAERFIERQVSAAVAGDLFGPRRIRVRREPVRGTAERADPAAEPAAGPAATAGGAGSTATGGAGPGDAIEGEVLPPP